LDDGHYRPKHVVSLLEYNIFLNKLCWLTTLSSLSLVYYDQDSVFWMMAITGRNM